MENRRKRWYDLFGLLPRNLGRLLLWLGPVSYTHLDVYKRQVPHTRLGRQQMTKLKVYAGAGHPHEAQQPTAITL